MPRANVLLLGLLPVLALGFFYSSSINQLSTNIGAAYRYWADGVALDPQCPQCSRSPKPPIIMGAIPHWSHMEKLLQLADGLVNKGYDVTFIGSPLDREDIERIGATVEPLDEYPPVRGEPFSKAALEKIAKMGDEPFSNPDYPLLAFADVFIDPMPSFFRVLQRALKRTNDLRTIFIHDASFFAAAPLHFGAPGVRPHTTIGIGVVPITADSNDTMPFSSGMLPETGPNAREIHWEAQREQDENHPIYVPLNKMFAEGMAKMGLDTKGMRFVSAVSLLPDVFCPLTIPEFEFPRSDLRPDVNFIGMPKSVGVSERRMPQWWDDVLQAKRDGKKIVAISRSSADFDGASIIAAMEGLKDRKDVLMVATLVNTEVDDFKRGRELPHNVYVAKFIPADLLYPHVDILVTNAGAGTIQHALQAGVPMVLGGVGEDKGQLGTLIRYSGVGMYAPELNAGFVRESVETILTDPSYRQKVATLKEIYKEYEPVDKLDEIIQNRTKQFEQGLISNRLH